MNKQITMEKSALGSQRHEETDNFSLREWALKANISGDGIKSRRHSASHIRSFREEATSFRSTTTISSTASSPGYVFQTEEIDPSTYSFTTALRALQARSGYGWEWMSPDRFGLNSKWAEAEKYICNPMSGEFPVECLSAKTLSGRSFATPKPKTTMSGPLVYPFRQPYIRSMSTRIPEERAQFPFEDKKEYSTKDAGTQSTPDGSPSPASTPARETCLSSKACSDSKFKIEIIKEVAEKEEQIKVQILKKCKQGRCLPLSLWKGNKKKKQENLKSSWKILICRMNTGTRK